MNTPPAANSRAIKRWRKYLADERAEATVYRQLAERRDGEEREILLALADAEGRHEAHWLGLLGDEVGKPLRTDLRTWALLLLARWFGSVFVLALAQRAEARSPYESDSDATSAMAADEAIHEEVVRGLAARGRNRLSGTFRAAVFGANDGLVSNLSLVLGVTAAGVTPQAVLITGIAGLLAGALSMAAGEYVSVRSQRELLDATRPNPQSDSALQDLDVDANELELVYRARGMSHEDAARHAAEVLSSVGGPTAVPMSTERPDAHESVGTGWGAAASSFCFFGSGAIIPLVPYFFGLTGTAAALVAAGLVGLALLGTGSIVGLLSGASPVRRALRQLLIGYAAAGVTYLLGLLFGAAGA